MSDDLLYFNGVNGDLGDYELPPMTGEELFGLIRGESTIENIGELRFRHGQSSTEHFGVKEGVDPKKLNESGWGVIFAHDADPAIEAALGELIQWRQEQAGDHFRIYKGADAFRVGKDNKNSFLARNGAGPGPADPDKVPYYLLVVGDPEKIPYRFQSQLDVQYAVGRVHFQTVEEYANYAHSVVSAEKTDSSWREMAFFGVANPDDKATQLSSQYLLEPLYQQFQIEDASWRFRTHLREEATKAQLGRLLGGDQTPALLFTGSHGMGFNRGSDRQLAHQGALLCQDWPGPQNWQGKGEIPQDFYFAGDDLESNAKLHGLIGLFFACYGGGTPMYDEFAKQAFKDRQQLADESFLAQLPCKMLSHPKGGALAVIGHVDRAWGYSFTWPKAGGQTEVFRSTIKRLLDGHPVGSAIEYFNERYAELSTMLTDQLEEIDFGLQADPYEVAGMWTANNDARGYAVIGDPAVRLVVADAGEQATGRSEMGAPVAVTPVVSTTPSTKPSTPVADTPVVSFDAADEASPAAALATDDALKVVNVTTEAAAGDGRQLRAISQIVLDGDVTTTLATPVTNDDAQFVALHSEMVKAALEARLAYLKLAQPAA
ncbi:MAG: C25 family cysteine peptidase [Caldilineaceae bacterium]